MTAPSGDYSIGSRVWGGLSKLVEELAEVLVECGKLLGSRGRTDHWSGDLKVRMEDECADAYAALDHFINSNPLLDADRIMARRLEKGLKFDRWAEEQAI